MTDYAEDPTYGLASAAEIDEQTLMSEAAEHLRNSRIVLIYGVWWHGAEDVVAALADQTGATTQDCWPKPPQEDAWHAAMAEGRGIAYQPGSYPPNLSEMTFLPELWANQAVRTHALNHLAPRIYRVHVDRRGDGQATYWSYDPEEILMSTPAR